MGKAGSKGFDRHLSRIKPLTDNQKAAFNEFTQGNHLILNGMAGTGKTFIALYLSLRDVLMGNTEQVVIVRSAVPTREMGYLPGSIEEKQRMYELPYMAMCCELFGDRNAYYDLQKNEMLEFISTSFIRGITLNQCIVIIEEIQNMNFQEIDSIITRLGKNSRFIVCGDIEQTDLRYRKNDTSGLESFLDIADKMRKVSIIDFDIDDVVRSGVVRDYLMAKYDSGF